MILLLLGAHLLVPYVLTHRAVSATLFSGLVVLVVLKHLGLLAVAFRPLYARFRQKSPHEAQKR
jgi:cytochrome bd-type quinol oxidase subunit 2